MITLDKLPDILHEMSKLRRRIPKVSFLDINDTIICDNNTIANQIIAVHDSVTLWSSLKNKCK